MTTDKPVTSRLGNLRPGDVFELPFTVKEVSSGGVYVTNTSGNVEWLDNARLAAGRRVHRPLAVGDRVKTRWPGIIRAISPDGSTVWVQSLDGTKWDTVARSLLERADQKEGG